MNHRSRYTPTRPGHPRIPGYAPILPTVSALAALVVTDAAPLAWGVGAGLIVAVWTLWAIRELCEKP